MFNGGVEKGTFSPLNLLKGMDLNGHEKVEEMVRKRKEGKKRQVNCVADTMLRNISFILHFTTKATEAGPVKSAAHDPTPGELSDQG